jgi:hypothetical protein
VLPLQVAEAPSCRFEGAPVFALCIVRVYFTESQTCLVLHAPASDVFPQRSNIAALPAPRSTSAPAYTPSYFRKNGKAVIVDFDVLDRILDTLPLAKIKPARAQKPEAA